MQVTLVGDTVTQDQARKAHARTDVTFDRSEDDCLRWLWRELYAADGVHSQCARCGLVRMFHRVRGRRAFACDRCGTHVYPSSGTFFERSSIGLSTWFGAVALIVDSDGRTPAKRIAHELSLSYRTALRMRERVLGAIRVGGTQAQLIMRIHDHVEASTNPTAPTRRPRAKSSHADATMEKIRAAASKTFARRGLAGARVADIAREAGVSTATIHYYFKSKEQVLLAALEWSGEQWDGKALRIRQETPNPIEALRRVLLWCMPWDGEVRDHYRLWLETWVAIERHPELMCSCAAMSAEWEDFFRDVVEAGTRAGTFTPVAPAPEVAKRIATMLTGLCLKSTVGYENWASEHATRVLFRFVAEQLALSPSAFGVFTPTE